VDGKLYLEHYGVKGMRWGVRKDRGSSAIRKALDREAAYRERVFKAYCKASFRDELTNDYMVLTRRDGSLPQRWAKSAGTYAQRQVTTDILSGNIAPYLSLDKRELKVKLATVAVKGTVSMILHDIGARRVLNGYDINTGKPVPNKKTSDPVAHAIALAKGARNVRNTATLINRVASMVLPSGTIPHEVSNFIDKTNIDPIQDLIRSKI
jgi:hypothetical protein